MLLFLTELILCFTHRLWNRRISAILCRAHNDGVINSEQLHRLAAAFDPTQDHQVYGPGRARGFASRGLPKVVRAYDSLIAKVQRVQIQHAQDPWSSAVEQNRLATAAPDLLHALQITTEWMAWWLENEMCDCLADNGTVHVCGRKQRHQELEQARSAIAKAGGSILGPAAVDPDTEPSEWMP